ncbi:MAG TPA: cell division protein ZapE [Thiolinea sp.]|nr:cell division protein ZapE [Thiolinea sp.]
MTLLARYQQQLAQNIVRPDALQEQAVILLQTVIERLQEPRKPPAAARGGLFGLFGRKSAATPDDSRLARGVYLWGGVGRGKTWIMDLFYAEVETPEKRRYHFHHFMEELHKALKHHEHEEDPLRAIAAEWGRQLRLICFDELHLTEVANAMLLFPLLEYLQCEGVILVITSNREPMELYQGNIKKELFVPRARRMREHMQVLHLDSGIDYRGEKARVVFGDHPDLAALSDADLARYFQTLSRGAVRENQTLEIHDRPVQTIKVSDNVLWLDFGVACGFRRTTSDYIWMAERFESVLLSDVYVMTTDHEEQARRFFYMVDEFYDQNISLLFSSAVPLTELYQGYRLKFAFKRTFSRLMEMQGSRMSVGA